MNIKCPTCGNGNVVSNWSNHTCFSCGVWGAGQARAIDYLGSVALARCLINGGRLAAGSDTAGNYWENLLGFMHRKVAMSVVPQFSRSMIAGIEKMKGLPGEGPSLVVGLSSKDLSTTWDGQSVVIEGEDTGRVMDDLAKKLSNRGTVLSKDFANLAVIGCSMLASTDDCRKWIQDGKQHSAVVTRVPDELVWANLGANPSKHPDPLTYQGNLVAVIPTWGLPHTIVSLGDRVNEVDQSSPFWSSNPLIPSRASLLADACDPQPILWSAINSNRGWSTACVAWFVSATSIITVSSSESLDDGTSVTTCVSREMKNHGQIKLSRVDNWGSIEQASAGASAIVEKAVQEHQKSGADFYADSIPFQMPEPYEVVRKITEDRNLWSPGAVRLLGTGINRTMIQWSTAIR